MGDVCDYIDYTEGKVVKNLEIDNSGNMEILEKSKKQSIELPKIKLHEEISNIFINTNIKPSNFNVNYVK